MTSTIVNLLANTDINTTVKIIKDSNNSPYRVEWLETDGYTRERPFNSYRAAERYAMQVDSRLQIEAFNRDCRAIVAGAC